MLKKYRVTLAFEIEASEEAQAELNAEFYGQEAARLVPGLKEFECVETVESK